MALFAHGAIFAQDVVPPIPTGYEQAAVDAINGLISNNGLLNWAYDEPSKWPESNYQEEYGVLWSDPPEPIMNLIALNINEGGVSGSALMTNLVNMEALYANSNELTSLDISGANKLWQLEVANNELTGLDVSGSQRIKYLNAANNKLTDLNLSNCVDLVWARVENNNLSSIDFTASTNLEEVYVQNNALSEIKFDDLSSFIRLNAHSNELTELDVSDADGLKELVLYNNKLTDLKFGGATTLEGLEVNGNKLTGLDVNGYSAITYLYAYNNELSDLDVGGVTTLKLLRVFNNKLTSLDVSDAAALERLEAYNNQLVDLTLGNTNALITLSVQNNNLTELDVRDAIVLKDLNVYNNMLTSLDVSGTRALQRLYAHDNQLTELILDDAAALETLWIHRNELTNLDISASPLLESLSVHDNQLTDLDAGDATSLRYLDASNNQLTSLNIDGASGLQFLYAAHNQLTTLDVGTSTKLEDLDVSHNRLTGIGDLSGLSKLQTVNVNKNCMPLSQLYALMDVPNLHLGIQGDVAFDDFGSAMATGTVYTALVPESSFGGIATQFEIALSDGSIAVEGVDYTMESDGKLTFLKAGDYVVAMTNEEVYSKGEFTYYDEDDNPWVVDFDTTDNPYGVANPLALVFTGQLTVLGDGPTPTNDRLLVRVEEAGASVNARRLAAGLDQAVFDNHLVLDGELGLLYSTAVTASTDAESLWITNQMHGETLAGGMDAVVRSAAYPFMQRLHGLAFRRPAVPDNAALPDSSWTAYANVSCPSSNGFTFSGSAVGQYADMSSHDGYLGYDVKNFGAFVALDRSWGHEGRLGLALGYSHTKVDWDDYGNRTRSDNFNAGLYASRFLDNFTFTGQANFGYADADNNRNIPSASVTAKGDYHMYWFGAGLTAAYTFDLGNCFLLTPSLGVDYLYSHSNSFSESGAGTANLRVDSQHRSTFDGRFGVEMAKTFETCRARITPSLNLGLGYMMGDRRTTVDYRFASAAGLPDFRADSAKLDRARFMAGAAIDVEVNERFTVGARYQGDFTSDYDSHYFHVGVGINF